MFFICKNIYFTKIARKGIHFLFNGKNVKQFCADFVQKDSFLHSEELRLRVFFENARGAAPGFREEGSGKR